MNSWIHGFMNSWIMNSWIHEFMDSGIHNGSRNESSLRVYRHSRKAVRPILKSSPGCLAKERGELLPSFHCTRCVSTLAPSRGTNETIQFFLEQDDIDQALAESISLKEYILKITSEI